jgi:hypothetical protein
VDAILDRLCDGLNHLDLSRAPPPSRFGCNHMFERQQGALGQPVGKLGVNGHDASW